MFGLFNKLFGSEENETKRTQKKIHDIVTSIENERKSKSKSRWDFDDVYRRATEEQEPTYKFLLGQIYYYGDGDIKPDYEKSIYWYTEAALSGDLPAMVHLGCFYREGDCGVEIDIEKAKYWFREAKKGGYNLNKDILEFISN
ncbi:hypothetical protein BKK51_10865 [Rodentibacter trehalosifermentans]|uniref:Sel1 repeat family protein n=2 Tax=Rodentibacter TaxID=1960084 RepID=A0A1V3IKG6_9PAST|nr:MULTISPECIES: tetratricopeptide repeat protein [Rodentibacter]OOF41496.1 hypothetical protein BKK50_08425 [Rodentibacter rarus]OOF43811.1 hypothetical protein BKK51_10865 [Rodentibacter trehalosifermentans]OOF45137.1 hypothetical protein BKK52_12865 [Rodentibacter trehalosifermentans]